MEKTTDTLTRPRFAFQWGENDLSNGQVFTQPSMTVPDDSLTIPEIIAKFTRSGMVPASVRMNDKGGNVAAEPDADPLDDFTDLQSIAAAQAAHDSAQAAAAASGESEHSAPAPAGA